MPDNQAIPVTEKDDHQQNIDHHTMTKSDKNASKSDLLIEVGESDLPLSCPLPEGELWNMHPRVYIDIESTGHASCPYCGARFRLIPSHK